MTEILYEMIISKIFHYYKLRQRKLKDKLKEIKGKRVILYLNPCFYRSYHVTSLCFIF